VMNEDVSGLGFRLTVIVSISGLGLRNGDFLKGQRDVGGGGQGRQFQTDVRILNEKTLSTVTLNIVFRSFKHDFQLFQFHQVSENTTSFFFISTKLLMTNLWKLVSSNAKIT
jgi:hypothetical protein